MNIPAPRISANSVKQQVKGLRKTDMGQKTNMESHTATHYLDVMHMWPHYAYLRVGVIK